MDDRTSKEKDRPATAPVAGSSNGPQRAGAADSASPPAAGVPYRTAVIVLHGMRDQKPLETVNSFVQTGLWPIKTRGDDEPRRRIYYSRPTQHTNSFEARTLDAIERKDGEPRSQTQTDFYEYHWSYRMSGNTLTDVVPLVRRLLLRLPGNVPRSLRPIWVMLWAVLIALVLYVACAAPAGLLNDFSLSKLTAALFPHALTAAAVTLTVFLVSAWVTSSFVDVVRYLDTSPRSYEVRQSIRQGMVDLLTSIQDDRRRYARVVVVAHSLGAYDAIQSLWTHPTERAHIEFTSLRAVQDAANSLPDPSSIISPEHDEIDAFHAAQLELFCEMRSHKLPWLITDFISVGTRVCCTIR